MKAKSYYSEKLSAERLKECYRIAPPRIQKYLNTEIQHVVEKLKTTDKVLELGCGYGRVMEHLCRKVKNIVGIDISQTSLDLAEKQLVKYSNYQLFLMDAVSLDFPDGNFDVVICVQNGISAFKVNKKVLIEEAVRVTRKGGLVLFSSYSNKIWDARLKWFFLQSDAGLIGEIDLKATGNGVIMTKDGFKATTIDLEEFISLTFGINCSLHTEEFDNSSIFYEMRVN